MDVRAQISTVFHLDKCIGCHTCSIACKNLWTSRQGTEYMWWNNVETKPGTGFPTLWENQDKYKGGWELKGKTLKPRIGWRLRTLTNIFFNPYLPTMDDYYEPWTYQYAHLFDAVQGTDQPIARAISEVTGEHLDIEAGPNWDDDLSGSPVYARNDTNLGVLTDNERQSLFRLEQMFLFYIPRICNHCLNPGCVAVCPTGAIYKRGEDGIVLVSQEKCRGWRFCISGCPYKKTYYNWENGKSEKCILCYPRQETGQAPACFHSCVGRIRYLGLLLYDADGIHKLAKAAETDLVAAQRSLILNPDDGDVIAGARKNGIPEDWIQAARNSPVYKLVKEWEIALPLHPEFRTFPMLFYVPPLSAVIGSTDKGNYNLDSSEFFGSLEETRIPLKYLAHLFTGNNVGLIREVLQKLWAVRIYQRSKSSEYAGNSQAKATISEAGCSTDEVEQIYRLTALPRFQDRFVIPPYHREVEIGQLEDPLQHKSHIGFGYNRIPKRGL
jgi:nitrate reductase / nitrite oxidoreductase, beta subunit